MKTQKQLFYTRHLAYAIAYTFGLLFLYAALNKLLDFEEFKVQIGKSAMLTKYTLIIAWTVPLIEIVITGMLVFKRTALAGLYAAFALMVMFTTYIFIILNYAATIPCSCGGVLAAMNWWQHLAFNGVFVVLGGVGIWLKEQRYSMRIMNPGDAEKPVKQSKHNH